MDIIFDLGNVILDWNTESILDSLDIDDQERSLLKKELFGHQDWLGLDCGRYSEADFIHMVTKRSDLDIGVIKNALRAAKESLTPIPESVRALREFNTAGMDIYCLSNMSLETYDFVKDLELFKFFKGVVISGQEKCMKPHIDIFNIIISRYELNPLSTLFIDDCLPNIQTAIGLGMKGLHFKRSKQCYSKLKDFIN